MIKDGRWWKQTSMCSQGNTASLDSLPNRFTVSDYDLETSMGTVKQKSATSLHQLVRNFNIFIICSTRLCNYVLN